MRVTRKIGKRKTRKMKSMRKMKGKTLRRKTHKRVRFTMRGGKDKLIKMNPYPDSFRKKDKNKQKEEFKKYDEEINKICKEIEGFTAYIFLPIDKREILQKEFDRKREEFLNFINKSELLLINIKNYNANDKSTIDIINTKHHTENLLKTFVTCYEAYKHVELVKDSAGKPQNLKKSESRNTPYENESETWGDKKDKNSFEMLDLNMFEKKPPRRHVERGQGVKPTPVLPEFTAAVNALTELDLFLTEMEEHKSLPQRSPSRSRSPVYERETVSNPGRIIGEKAPDLNIKPYDSPKKVTWSRGSHGWRKNV